MYTEQGRDFVREPMYGDHTYQPAKARLASCSVSKYLKDVHKLRPSNAAKSLLDLGGGLGYYSRAFARHGLTVSYVEPDPYSFEFSKTHKDGLNIRLHNNLLDEFLRTSEQVYDVIFFRHVIEHMTHPLEIVRLLSRVMHDDTLLIVETDNNASLELIYHPASFIYWRTLYSEEFNLDVKQLLNLKPFPLGERETHYWGFNIENLAHLFLNTGFDVLFKREYSLGDKYYWPNIASLGRLVVRRPSLIRQALTYLRYRMSPSYHGAGLLLYATKAQTHFV